jgi:transposase
MSLEPTNNVRGWLRTQLWKLPGGTMVTLPERLRTHARASERELPPHIERQLTMLTQVSEQVKAANQQARRLATEHPVCRRLMTVPGVGPIIAPRFVAAIDDPSRFSTAHRCSPTWAHSRVDVRRASPPALRAGLLAF